MTRLNQSPFRKCVLSLVRMGFCSLFIILQVSTSSLLAGEWLPENDRIEVDLSGKYRDLEGNSISFAGFTDDVLMLNFWATWCGPCRIEMPSMAKLHEALEGKGLRIITITEEDEQTVRLFLEQNPYPFTFMIDPQGTLSERLRVWAVPLTIILDRNRKLTYFHQGPMNWDTPDMKKRLRRLVKE
ncbi:MAG: TlpA family protein disulfide reductase, partial [bacterium]